MTITGANERQVARHRLCASWPSLGRAAFPRRSTLEIRTVSHGFLPVSSLRGTYVCKRMFPTAPLTGRSRRSKLSTTSSGRTRRSFSHSLLFSPRLSFSLSAPFLFHRQLSFFIDDDFFADLARRGRKLLCRRLDRDHPP